MEIGFLQFLPRFLFTIGFFVPGFSNKYSKARLPFHTENVGHFLHYGLFLVQNNGICELSNSRLAIFVDDLYHIFYIDNISQFVPSTKWSTPLTLFWKLTSRGWSTVITTSFLFCDASGVASGLPMSEFERIVYLYCNCTINSTVSVGINWPSYTDITALCTVLE